MRKLLAVEGLTINHSAGSPVSGGSFSVTSIASTKMKAEGNGVYRGTLSFTFTGGTHSSGTSGTAVASGTISFTATKNKIDGQFVLREGDTGSMTGTYVPPATPPPTVPFTSDVEITAAGQSTVLGE